MCASGGKYLLFWGEIYNLDGYLCLFLSCIFSSLITLTDQCIKYTCSRCSPGLKVVSFLRIWAKYFIWALTGHRVAKCMARKDPANIIFKEICRYYTSSNCLHFNNDYVLDASNWKKNSHMLFKSNTYYIDIKSGILVIVTHKISTLCPRRNVHYIQQNIKI